MNAEDSRKKILQQQKEASVKQISKYISVAGLLFFVVLTFVFAV